MSDWQSIETAPKDDEILVWDGVQHHIVEWATDHWMDRDYSTVEPTHWMPLPTPPAQHIDPSSGLGEK